MVRSHGRFAHELVKKPKILVDRSGSEFMAGNPVVAAGDRTFRRHMAVHTLGVGFGTRVSSLEYLVSLAFPQTALKAGGGRA